ncbi:MAG: DNA alkylation repair protein [Lachnospiraceae bacterium]|nr:DNA alkylation repair protein [Lachnospiraceae bacterium]
MGTLNEELKTWLQREAEQDYKKFSAALIPGCDNMLGIRIPLLRKKAKELAKGDWRQFLQESEDEYFEETMVAGMVIGYARMEIAERIEWFRQFVPRIHNWSVNDCVCSTIKLKPEEREPFWQFLMEYKDSKKEYEVRVVAVMLMNQFLLPEYIEKTVKTLASLYDSDYYGSMGIAWALATAYAKFPKEIKAFLHGEFPQGNSHCSDGSHLSDATYSRAIQKMLESYRVSTGDKEMLRELKRQYKK